MKPILFTFAFAATLAAQNFIQMSDPQFGMFTKDASFEHETVNFGVRLGCGLVVGLVVGFFVAFRYAGATLNSSLAWTVGGGVIFGILPAAFGDRFWYRFMTAFRWLFYPYP
jgi:hypothetical protein